MESLKAFSLTLWPVRKNAVLGIAVICGQLLHYIPHLGCIMCKNGAADIYNGATQRVLFCLFLF